MGSRWWWLSCLLWHVTWWRKPVPALASSAARSLPVLARPEQRLGWHAFDWTPILRSSASRGGKPAVQDQRLSRNVFGVRAGQIANGLGDLFHAAETAQGNALRCRLQIRRIRGAGSA